MGMDDGTPPDRLHLWMWMWIPDPFSSRIVLRRNLILCLSPVPGFLAFSFL